MFFRHVDESLMRRMGEVVDFDRETFRFQGRDDLLHPLVRPQGVVVGRNADRQEERPSEDVQRFIVVDDIQDVCHVRVHELLRIINIRVEVPYAQRLGGHLVYLRGGTLYGMAFDLDRLEPAGPPATLLEGIAASNFGGGQLDFSRNGTLVYLAGNPTMEAKR